MSKKLSLGAIVIAIQFIAYGLEAAELPQHDAPFDLRFGMSAADVALPLSPPPVAPITSTLCEPSDYDCYTQDFLNSFNEKELFKKQRFQAELNARESLLHGCASTFDTPNLANNGDASWVDWISTNSVSQEISDLDPIGILEPSQFKLYQRFEKQLDKNDFLQRESFRSLSIHKLNAAGRDREICLIFTKEGLTHVYAPLNDFEDVIMEIFERLSANSDYEKYSSKRHYTPNIETYGRKYVSRRLFWLDKSRKIMVAAKNTEGYHGLNGFIMTTFLKNDFDDGLSLYLAYTDLSRRSRTIDRYREEMLPVLSANIRDVYTADEARKKLEDEIERKKKEVENSDRKSLIDSFK